MALPLRPRWALAIPPVVLLPAILTLVTTERPGAWLEALPGVIAGLIVGLLLGPGVRGWGDGLGLLLGLVLVEIHHALERLGLWHSQVLLGPSAFCWGVTGMGQRVLVIGVGAGVSCGGCYVLVPELQVDDPDSSLHSCHGGVAANCSLGNGRLQCCFDPVLLNEDVAQHVDLLLNSQGVLLASIGHVVKLGLNLLRLCLILHVLQGQGNRAV